MNLLFLLFLWPLGWFFWGIAREHGDKRLNDDLEPFVFFVAPLVLAVGFIAVFVSAGGWIGKKLK